MTVDQSHLLREMTINLLDLREESLPPVLDESVPCDDFRADKGIEEGKKMNAIDF